jgi:threonine dehydrogenase-like Zn-dependent dehydrogenase
MEARRLKAIVFDGDTATVQVRPEPRPRPDEALVRVRLAGVCATDLEIVRGYGEHRGILGHEMVGEVEACAPTPRGWGAASRPRSTCRAGRAIDAGAATPRTARAAA